jgi:hypothetical protein
MVDGLEAHEDELPRGFVLFNTILALLTQAWFVFIVIFSQMMRGSGRMRGDFWVYLAYSGAIAALASVPWSAAGVWRFLRHGTAEWSTHRVGQALLEALLYEGSIERKETGLRVLTSRRPDGSVYCWLGGGTGQEQTIFLRAMRTVLGAIDNPRYLLARRRILRFFREDYFAVPEILARKKEFAERFVRKWRRAVGPVELVYTRTPEGRRMLLRARIHSLAGAFQKGAERVSCWK